MAAKIKLPCGLNNDGKLIYIDEARNGLECNCVCPACKQPLVAKNGGSKREHHFAHLNVVECEHGYQSALHYMGKDCFLEMEHLTFIKNGVPVQYKIDTVSLEHRIDDIIPDILVTCDGKQFIVEIYVTHAVDDKKKQKIKDLQISAIEIDISRFQHEMIDKETLKHELGNVDNFSWVYDADEDLIEQKRSIIQRLGMKIPIGIGNSIMCPFLAQQQNQFTKCVTLDFCLHCPNCVYETKADFIRCGSILPLLVHENGRRCDIVVNENKVMFESEFKKWDKEFLKNLEKAMQLQYRIFLNIACSSYVPPAACTISTSHQTYRPRHYHSHHRRKR